MDILLSTADKSILYDQDRRGCCPIHYAAATGDADILAKLILHGASPSQADAKGFLPVDYCDPTNVACLNLLLCPTDTTENSDADTWETRERLDGSGAFQFNPATGEARVDSTAPVSVSPDCSSDDQLLQRFYHTAASLGLQGLLASQRTLASSFAIGQAKARLHLLQANERTKTSLLNTLSTKDATISGLEEQLQQVVHGRNVDAARLDAALQELAKARAAKEEVGALEERVAAQEEDISRLTAGLHGEQDLRQQATAELMRVMNELSALQTHLRAKEDITADQEAQLSSLEADKAQLHARIESSSSQIAAFEQQIKDLMRHSSITAQKLDDLEQELRAEQRLKLKASSRVDDLQAKLDASQSEIIALRTAASHHQHELEEARAQLARDKEREQQLRAEAEARERGMAFQLDAASGELLGLQERLEQERKEKEAASAALEDISRRLAAVEHGSRASQEEMDVLAAEKRRLGGRLETAKAKLERVEGEVEATRRRLAEEERSRLAASAKVEALQGKLRAMEEARQLDEAKHKMHHREEEARVATLAAERAELQRQLEEARRAQVAQADAAAAVKEKEEAAAAAEKENDVLRRRLKEEQKWREEAMAALAECKKQEVEQRKQVVQATRKQLEEVHGALAEEKRKALEAKRELEKVVADADEGAKQSQMHKSRAEEQVQRAKDLEDQQRELRQRLEELEAAKQAMQGTREAFPIGFEGIGFRAEC